MAARRDELVCRNQGVGTGLKGKGNSNSKSDNYGGSREGRGKWGGGFKSKKRIDPSCTAKFDFETRRNIESYVYIPMYKSIRERER